MKKSFLCIGIAAIMLLQLNHLAVMNLVASHDVASQCASGQSSSADKCLCCIIEQADKTAHVTATPNHNIVLALPPLLHEMPFFLTALNSEKYNLNKSPHKNKWLRTVVQNK